MNNNDYSNKIGVFDSGMGGLNVLSELEKLLPNYSYMYFADTKNVPYGTKSNEDIFLYAKNIIDFFINKDIRNIVIACNTVSAVAYEELQELYKNKVTFFPVLQNGINYAKEIYSQLDNVAILATKATTKSGMYEKLLKNINPNLKIINIDGTGLVEIIEEDSFKNSDSIDFIKNLLKPIETYNINNLILGCTHYSYLLPIFKQFYDINYYDPSYYLAMFIKESLVNTEIKGTGQVQYFVSSEPDSFKKKVNKFYNIESVNLITD